MKPCAGNFSPKFFKFIKSQPCNSYILFRKIIKRDSLRTDRFKREIIAIHVPFVHPRKINPNKYEMWPRGPRKSAKNLILADFCGPRGAKSD